MKYNLHMLFKNICKEPEVIWQSFWWACFMLRAAGVATINCSNCCATSLEFTKQCFTSKVCPYNLLTFFGIDHQSPYFISKLICSPHIFWLNHLYFDLSLTYFSLTHLFLNLASSRSFFTESSIRNLIQRMMVKAVSTALKSKHLITSIMWLAFEALLGLRHKVWSLSQISHLAAIDC